MPRNTTADEVRRKQRPGLTYYIFRDGTAHAHNAIYDAAGIFVGYEWAVDDDGHIVPPGFNLGDGHGSQVERQRRIREKYGLDEYAAVPA